jgi:glutathione peroxidase
MTEAVKLVRLLAFSLLGGLLSLIGRKRAAGRPVDWPATVLPSIAGTPLPTADYAGHVVLLVNTASKCGFSPQYRGLEALWRRYRDRGLVVLGVPSNDFGGQEPGSDAEIGGFCQARFDVSFPLASKQIVSGPAAHPLYRFAAAQTGVLGTPCWNFHKILIGRDGRIVDWFSAVSGAGAKLDRAVEDALAVHAGSVDDRKAARR